MLVFLHFHIVVHDIVNIDDIELSVFVNFYCASYASTVLAVILCLSVRPSVRHKSELYKDG